MQIKALSACSLVTVGLLLAGCGSSDEQPATPSTTSSTASTTATPSTTLPATPTDMTIFQYLDQHGVQLDFQKPATLTGLKVDWSAPPPWKQADSAETETSYQILARADTPAGQYIPRALLIIAKLSVPVDAREAIKYGFVDVEQLDQFHRTNASLDDFDGNPSSFVSGTYPREGVELSTTTRYVIVTVPAGQYFVQLSTTIAASQQTQFGSEVDAINAGLRISPA